MSWLKAKLLLLWILVVWCALIYTVWPVQLTITVLGFIPNDHLRRLRYNFWIWQDQGVNVSLLGNPDVTVSSKIGYMARQGSKTAKAMAVVVDFLFYITIGQKNHCDVSIEHDEEHYNYRG